MHAINKTRNAKGMLKMWRFQPTNFMAKVSRSFAEKTHQAMIYTKRIESKHHAV